MKWSRWSSNRRTSFIIITRTVSKLTLVYPRCNPSLWKLCIGLNMTREKTCFMHICIPLKSVKPFRRSCVDEMTLTTQIMSPYSCPLVIILLHAHLHTMYYEHIKFHWNPSNRLGGVALTRSLQYISLVKLLSDSLLLPLSVGYHVASCISTNHGLPLYKFSLKSVQPYRRSCAYEIYPLYFINKICQIISPKTCPLIIILFHAHLHIMYYECIKFHWNSSNVKEALTSSMDRQTDRQTEGP